MGQVGGPKSSRVNTATMTLRKGNGGFGFLSWAQRLCDWSSIHGICWFNRVDNNFVRLCCCCLAFAAAFGLPPFLAYQMLAFAHNLDVLNKGRRILIQLIAEPSLFSPNLSFSDLHKVLKHDLPQCHVLPPKFLPAGIPQR